VTPTRVVWLNATELAIAHAELAGEPARLVKGDDDFIGLTIDRTLPAGALAIDVAFTASIDAQRSRGLYSEREGSDSYLYTFFESTDARRAFPCFDEPNYKVPWQLTFHVKAGHVALANAPTVREAPEPGGLKRVEVALTKPLPSYLVAFVVGPFELIDGGTAGRVNTPIRFIIPKGRAGELGYAKEVTPKVVVALESYFDMAYPYGKLDVAVVPRFWGTMEHPGIVAMGQPLTLIRPEQATRTRKHSYANILAHELSHYWFGDLVTMAWWDDTWLNEALGTWSDMNITEAAEPTWRVRDDRVGVAMSGMTADETLSTQAIRMKVTKREQIGASFDNAITYFKGASIFRMFESFVGRDAWRSFINHYLARHAWGNASADDFLRSMSEQLGADTAASIQTFLQQPGVPRITARLHCEANAPPRVELSQQRSLPSGVTDPAPKLWTVPVCLRYGDAASSFRRCVSLVAPAATFDLGGPAAPAPASTDAPAAPWTGCPTWLIVNADAVGYYRSTVDPAIARALFTPSSPIAKSAKPTPAERIMLVEDLRAMVLRDELEIDKLLALTPLIAADPDDKVARSALVAADLPLSGLPDPMYRAARQWYQKTFRARAGRLGWQRGTGDSEERQDLRRSLVPMVASDDPALAATAAKLADHWLADRTGIADDLVGPALAVAARHGDGARFERILAAARAARDRTEHGRLLGALGAFTDPAIASKALALVLAPDLDLRETVGIVHGVLAQRETRDLGIAFVTEHLDELLAHMRSDDASGFLGRLARRFCDAERRDKIATLIVPRAAKLDGAHPMVTRGLEEADQCIARVHRQLPALRRLLETK